MIFVYFVQLPYFGELLNLKITNLTHHSCKPKRYNADILNKMWLCNFTYLLFNFRFKKNDK